MDAQNDKKIDGSEQVDSKQVLYLGVDEGYWQGLKQELSNYKQIGLSFKRQWADSHQKLQDFIYQIHLTRPRVVLIDLEKHTEEMLHVLRAVLRTNSISPPLVVALTHYTQDESVLKQAVLSGVKCVHVKSSEVDSIVYDILCFAFNNALEDHGFATAGLDDVIKVYFPAKVSMVTPKGVVVESNIELKEKEKYVLKNYWDKKGILKSANATLSKQSRESLFYKFEYAQTLSFDFIKPLEAAEDIGPAELEEMQAQADELLQETKARMSESLELLRPQSSPKLIKTLVVDKEMVLYRQSTQSDSYPFLVRVQPYLIDAKTELRRLRPHMIAYHFEEVAAETLESNQDLDFMFNESKNLANIIKTIKALDNYSPFLVIFNSDLSTEELQSKYNYKQIIGYGEPLGPELLVQMGHILLKRLGSTVGLPPEAVVIDKNNSELSFAELELEINLVACSEKDVFFNSELELKIGDVFYTSSPAPAYLTVAPTPNFPKAQSEYYAVVHGVSEKNKKELRRFVNSVFFREKELSKQQEKEQQELAKAQYLEKKKAAK